MTTKEAIEYFGDVQKMAAVIGIWPHSILRWHKYPPLSRQREIELLTRGKLKAQSASEARKQNHNND